MNIWDFNGWKIITTNGIIKKNGEAVMGAGLALQAKQRYPSLPKKLAVRLKSYGNVPHYFAEYDIITFPTKNHWREDSDLTLIDNSCLLLAQKIDNRPDIFKKIAMPRVGCQNGRLVWDDVKPIVVNRLWTHLATGIVEFV